MKYLYIMTNPKRPKDFNQRAKLIVDLAIGEKEEKDPNKLVNLTDKKDVE